MALILMIVGAILIALAYTMTRKPKTFQQKQYEQFREHRERGK